MKLHSSSCAGDERNSNWDTGDQVLCLGKHLYKEDLGIEVSVFEF